MSPVSTRPASSDRRSDARARTAAVSKISPATAAASIATRSSGESRSSRGRVFVADGGRGFRRFLIEGYLGTEFMASALERIHAGEWLPLRLSIYDTSRGFDRVVISGMGRRTRSWVADDLVFYKHAGLG